MRKNTQYAHRSNLHPGAHSASQQIRERGEELHSTVTEWIERRPIQSVLLSLGAGLVLGRLRVRPIESIFLATVAGIGWGFAMSRTGQPSSARGRSDE
jgi:hypothetical protein